MDLFDLNPGEDVGTPSPSASPSSTHSCISTSASALVPSLPPSAPTSSSVCLELWHACAGPLISLPKKGSVVVYLPRRHFEQSQDFPLTSCNNIPPHVFCRVLDVKLHAEEESDEVFCQVLLVPESEQVEQSLREGEVDADGEEEDTEAMVKSTTPHMFCKTLTASDTSHGGFSVPRRAAEDCFPPLDYHLRPSQELVAKDLHGLKWKFRHIYRGQPRRHLLTTGWSTFVNKKKLVSGDTVLFLRAEDGELRLGIRRENQLKSAGSFAGPSGQKLNPATVMDVVNALSTRCAFSVCYNPRASSSEFIIPVHRFLKSLDCPYSVEKRFMMHFGTEDAAERRYPHLGTTLHHVYRPQRWFSPSENLSNTKPLTPSENLSNTKPLTAWTNVENKIIKKVKYVAPKPLHIEEVKSLLDMESDDKAVRMLSIYGSDKIKGTMLGSTKHEVVDWSGSAVQDMKRLDSIKHDWSGSAFEDKKRLDSIKHDWNGGAFEDMKQLDSIKHDWSGGALVDIKRLEITSLTVRDTSLSSELQHLLDNLKYLHWEVSPLNSLPQKFPPKKFSYLTCMKLSNIQSISKIPDMSVVPNLRELRLDNCRNLIEVHESVGFLKKLDHLSVLECTKLEYFLRRMFLPSLEVLNLNFCAALRHFPDIMEKMEKSLKIYMKHTSIWELPDSIGNLIGLVYIEIQSSKKPISLPSSLFMLPNAVTFMIGGCSQLRKSLGSFVQNPSAACNVQPSLQTLYFKNGGLSDGDLLAILNCIPKLEKLYAPGNYFVSLPACIKKCVYLTNLDVSLCRKLQRIPEFTNLTILNVHRCVNLEEILELPSTIQKIDARCCFSLTTEASDMLWFQARKERRGLEIVMPKTEIPKWFDFIGKGGNPHFWARCKFPIVALALVFHDVSESSAQSRCQLVRLHLVINGQCVPCNGYHNFRIAQDHVLICDLRVLFSDKEWRGLDTFLEHDWNLVQLAYKAASPLALTAWGIFLYRQETIMEDVQFMCPDTKYSDMSITSPSTVPTIDSKQEQIKMIEKDDFAGKQMHTLKESVQEISRQTKDALESKGLALDHESSTLRWLLDTIKNTDYEEAEPEDSFDHKDVAVKDEVDAAMDVGEASTSRHIWEEAAEGNDGHQQQEIFIDGMVDGLLEAKSSIRSLDFGKTLSAALDKMSQHWVTLTGSDPEVEMKVYKEGIMCGLREASLSFPNLDIETTLNAVVNTETQSHDEAGMDLREYEGRDSDEEQGSDQEMRRVLWGGMADGLLEAIKTFPALDIQTTIRTALNKTTWLPPNPRVEVNIYIKGIVKGLREAKLTFPTLDILATLNIVLSRETQNRPPDTEPPPMVNEVLGQHQNLSDTDEDDEAKTFEISDSESLALTSTDSETLTDIGEDCTDVAKYDKLTIFLEGRVEELQRLYDAEMESFHNSKKFEHLSKAIYWKGLIDGLLDAPSILHAMDHERITEQVLKENEASVKEEHVEAADHNENLDGTTGETVSSPDRKRQKRDTVADILGYKRERDDTGFEQENNMRKREKGN